MLEENTWTIRIMRTARVSGKLTLCYAHVLSSNGTVRGSIEFRGKETSNLLSALQMLSPTIRVIDCSQKGAANGTQSSRSA